jgi:CheY-like chemotaxis protein
MTQLTTMLSLRTLKRRLKPCGFAWPRLHISCARAGYQEFFQNNLDEKTEVTHLQTAGKWHSRSLRVLIVGDDDLHVLAMKALGRSGHEVKEAGRGEEGLALMDSCNPELLLLDLNMPGTDGFEILRAVRTRTETLPVIVLTAMGDEESARSSFQLGATDFLAKPFTPPNSTRVSAPASPTPPTCSTSTCPQMPMGACGAAWQPKPEITCHPITNSERSDRHKKGRRNGRPELSTWFLYLL